jgi:hypothetical protein
MAPMVARFPRQKPDAMGDAGARLSVD